MNGPVIFICVAAVLAAAIVFAVIIPYRFIHMVARPKRMDPARVYEIETRRGNMEGYESLPRIPVAFVTSDGYTLHGEYIPNGGNKYVIITHGFTYCRYGSVKYMKMYRAMGFDVIIYDNRGCGENAESGNTMGAVESRDLAEIIKYLRGRTGESRITGIHGESQGAATTLLALRSHPDISFAVADCSYGDAEDFFREKIKERYHLPQFVASLAFFYGRVLFGFDVDDMKVTDGPGSCDIPVCIIHGDSDELVPVHFAKEIFDACAGRRELHIVRGAGHARAFETSPENYREIVENFLKH